MTFESYVWFSILLILVSDLVYWVMHWSIHSPKLNEDYSGFMGWCRYGRKLKWNMLVFALFLFAVQSLTAPPFQPEPQTRTGSEHSLFS